MPMTLKRGKLVIELSWYIDCKVCGNLHREAQPVHPGFNMKVAGKMECPLNPGKYANYNATEWLLMTDSEFRRIATTAQMTFLPGPTFQ